MQLNNTFPAFAFLSTQLESQLMSELLYFRPNIANGF